MVGLLITVATGRLAAQTSSTAAGAVDPTGKFDVTVVLSGGQTGTGRVVIRGTPSKYEGTLAADGGQGPLEITSLSFQKDSVVISMAPASGGQGSITFHLKFEEPGFSGRFEGVESGQIKGTRIK